MTTSPAVGATLRSLLDPAVLQVVDAAIVWAATEKTRPPQIEASGAFLTITLRSPLPVSLARAAESAGFEPSADPHMERWTARVIPKC